MINLFLEFNKKGTKKSGQGSNSTGGQGSGSGSGSGGLGPRLTIKSGDKSPTKKG